MVREKHSLVAGGKDKSCFFKIFFPKIMAQQLKIPSHFVKHILKRVTASRAILTGPSGGRWRVEIFKTADDVYLADGWQGFVRDNLLRDLDFLLFEYDGNMCFTVQVFDKSGLERGICPPEDATHCSSRGKNLRRPEVYPVDSINFQKKLPSRCRPGEISACAAVKEGAKSFSSQFPFFETLMKDYNVQRNYILCIPRPFTDEYFLKDKSKVILRSLDGKAWEVNCRVYCGKFSFAVGWRSFANSNRLKVGDVCIFELVGEMELQVHIFNK